MMQDQYYSSELSLHVQQPIRNRLFHADGYIEALALAIHSLGALARLRTELSEVEARIQSQREACETTTIAGLRAEGYREGLVWAMQIVQQEEVKSGERAYQHYRPRIYAQMLYAMGLHDGLEFSLSAKANLANLGAESYQVGEQIALYQLPAESYEAGYLFGLQEAIRLIEQAGTPNRTDAE